MFKAIVSIIPTDLLITLGLCVIASFCVGFVMRFFVKTCLVKLDAYIKEKHPSDKVAAIYQTVKSISYFLIAAILVAFVLHRLMAICPFPMDNNKALAIFYFIPIFALQWFFDAHMKKIAARIFGLPYNGEDEEKEPKPVKVAKPKVHSRKVYYTIDEEGNEVPVEQ